MTTWLCEERWGQGPRPFREYSVGDEVAVWRRGTGKVSEQTEDELSGEHQGSSWALFRETSMMP